MAGVLLNSGNLQQYTAIGDEGQPVYAVASQLRETVRLRAGAAAADCLAIARVNDARSSIDWYSPHEGMVVPWSAATEQERTEALQSLESFHQTMVSVTGALDGVSAREKRVFQNLLSKVFHFPDQDCVFLVNGSPVLTFWGFQAGVAAPAQDPFTQLRPVPIAAAAAPNATASLTASRRPWWLWLLLLLLLAALLFWWLRGCSPTPIALAPEDQAVVVQARDLEHTPDTSATQESATAGVVGTDLNRAVDIDLDRANRDRARVVGQDPIAITGDQAVEGIVTESLASDTLTTDGTLNVGEGEATVIPGDNAEGLIAGGEGVGEGVGDGVDADAESNDRDVLASETDAPLAPSAEVSAEPSTAPTPPEVAGAGQDTGQDSGTDTQARADAAAATRPSLGAPMAIPAAAIQSGSVKFLDGNWRAAGGMQDSATGQPVRLQYQFDNGQAKVTVQRGNGVQCEGVSRSSIRGGQLQIAGQGTVATCSDGSTFALPEINCTPDQSGQARCTGNGQDGRSLPITIRQMP